VVNHGGICADPRLDGPNRGFRDRLSSSSLPAFLKQQGLHTVFIGGFGERHSAWSFYAGFREIHDTGLGGLESAEQVTPTVLEWIERSARKEDWYLHINYWDPHTPYRAPQEFGNPFANQPLPAWFSEALIQSHRRLPGPHTAQDLAMYDNHTDSRYPRYPGEIRDLADLRRVIDGYDCGIAYMDRHIGRVFAALAEEGVLDDLAIIISADHGENFGELGIYGEHATADLPNCRIPLIVRWPAGGQGSVDRGLHYHLDLLPTLAGLFGMPASPRWDGQSFAPAILEGKDCGRNSLVLSQCAHVCQRSARWGDWLYLRTYHDGYHLFPGEMLFNLKEDPYEQADLAGSRPEACARGREILQTWQAAMLETMPEGYTQDPLQIVLEEGGPFHARGFLKRYCTRLEATGRGEAAEMLRKRHPREIA
jgi:arylsulfatase A-like enzyme